MSADEATAPLTRESLTATTFVEIVDSLVSNFDVVEALTVLATRCVELLEVSAAGILLADDGHFRVIGASSELAQLLELFQVQNDQGPCFDSYRAGRVVAHSDLRGPSHWPDFAELSVTFGYLSVCAVPLRHRSVTLGCLNLFIAEPEPLSAPDLVLAQALADVATIAMIQDQAARDAADRETRLQHALDSRVSIEQAKGIISEHNKTDMDDAFARLRSYARHRNLRLTETAQALVVGTLTVDEIAPRRPSPPPARSGAEQDGSQR